MKMKIISVIFLMTVVIITQMKS